MDITTWNSERKDTIGQHKKKIKRWAMQTQPKNRGWIQVPMKG